MSLRVRIAAAALAVLAAGEASARCSVSGRFRFASEGPWPFYVRVGRDTACLNRQFRVSGNAVFRRLNAYELPTQGQLSLKPGGRWNYVPRRGYAGPDAFLLEVCGTRSSGEEACSKLSFSVTVE